MDAFEVHRRLIDDYSEFTLGFVDIHDARIKAKVQDQINSGAQWPDPWLSLNPAFESGGTIDQAVADGVLHPQNRDIFRFRSGGESSPVTLHRHQRDAVEIAGTGASYVLTTGTGSGKSMAYIVPIVDRVLRHGTGKGIQAIVVYPMNALANSQVDELRKFLPDVPDGAPPVTFRRYTGQESSDERAQILKDPPDILLTNYVMLELVLTRPEERDSLIRAAQGLKFLVLDELHTYRGRQGADVSLLVRRVRDACGANDSLQCVGTSATMSNGGTVAEQQLEVAGVASRIFGTTVLPSNVITETLVRATTRRERSAAELQIAVDNRGDAESSDPALKAGFDSVRKDPLASWIEDTFGITEEVGTGRLVRRKPTTVQVASAQLAEITARSQKSCATAIRQTLLAGPKTKDPSTQRPLFAFRLHQFLSKGGSIYTTAQSETERSIELEFQVELEGNRRLFPLAFCRECGQEYLMARRSSPGQFQARHNLRPSDREDGYFYISNNHPWPSDPLAEGRLPSSWLEEGPKGIKIKDIRRKDLPDNHLLSADGFAHQNVGETTVLATWIPQMFRFCLRCGVSHEASRANEFSKLVTLDKEGRSSAMTVVATSILRALRAIPEGELGKDARKLLTFVDNRQDASLQAGHLNDFVLVAQLRAGIYRAIVDAGNEGLDPIEIGPLVSQALNLDPSEFAQAPDAIDLRAAKRALAKVVEYRALRDLQRGWRITLPNLEQSGLLRISYPAVAQLVHTESRWEQSHTLLVSASPERRQEIIHVLLDEFRRILAVDSEALTPESADALARSSGQHLQGLWTVSAKEPPPELGLVGIVPRPQTAVTGRTYSRISGRGAYGRWLGEADKFGFKLGVDEVNAVVESLFEVLLKAGLISAASERGLSGFRLKVSAMQLFAGDGNGGAADPVRRKFEADKRPRVIKFFRELYKEAGAQLAGLRAAEHTAQVRADDREAREQQFRDGSLPLLFCSPTMELGVDIAHLNAVAMRNVPPTPANYAQRSGRAGRSGEPAVVVTYCASGNSHDTYYFQRSELMVSGQVQAPRLDLANEDLVRSHIHAVWLAEALAATKLGLGRSMADILSLEMSGYPVNNDLTAVLNDPLAAAKAKATARRLLAPLTEELSPTAWWDEAWSDAVIDNAVRSFDGACNRWRELYSTAVRERLAAEKIDADVTVKREERDQADRRRQEARQRISLLLNESEERGQSDFYSYRYFGSEGFLPGYSFPRLPLAAFIPGNRGKDSSWLQRPRFLAITEFGPGALIYHEGARYQVTRISLPRSGDTDIPGDVVRSQVRVCESCGYHHRAQVGMDVCQSCNEPLTSEWKDLVQLQSVITRRRERISSDEEERNRTGFELVTTYRFMPRGKQSGRADASVRAAGGEELAELSYGDAAEIRVTNLGRRNRKRKDNRGFWLDLVKGQWLSDAVGESDEDELEAKYSDVKVKNQVIPFVEDRRNIVVLRWSETLSEQEATTLRFAIERGMEATFQLEDSELTSESLPDAQEQGRLLLVEAAEGGAGVLRRVQTEPGAMALVAAKALEIIHIDPTTGEELEDSCVRGCYRCLLSYGNQQVHELIDRRLVIKRLMMVAAGTTSPIEGTVPEAPVPIDPTDLGNRAVALLALLVENDLRMPHRVAADVGEFRADLVFDDPSTPTAVFVEEVGSEMPDAAALNYDGWNVVSIRLIDDLAESVQTNPSVFGAMI